MTMGDSTRPCRATALPFLGVLSVAGPDALNFLQGQVTSDVRLLADGRTQLAALNTPQGRVVALPRLRLVGEAVYALLPAELLEPMCALLRRFVLRSRVQLQVASDLEVRWIDAGTIGAATGVIDHDPTTPTSPVQDTTAPPLVAFDYAPGRMLIAATADAWRSMAGAATVQAQQGVENEWLAMDIAEGLPQVFAATSGTFVAQMLNLDLLDAISFSKGCYTGQEIVARTQHLGRIKRRLLGYRLPPGAAPAAAAGLYRDGTKLAEILMSAVSEDGVRLLAVASLEALGLPLLTEDGRKAQPVELPYSIAAHDQPGRPGG